MRSLDSKQVEQVLQNYSKLDPIKLLLSEQFNYVAGRKHAEINKLYLCHATQFFPEQGIIYPRLNFQFNEKDSLYFNEHYSRSISILFSILRPSVHFSLNSLANPHGEHSGFGEKPYIIIDPLVASAQIVGGYIEDMFTFGSYTLTNQATILVPHTRKELIQEKILNLPKGAVISYYDNYEETIRQFFAKKNSAYLDTHQMQNDPAEPIFYGKLGSKFVSSLEINKQISGRFCTHDITPFAQIESIFAGNKVYNQAPFFEALSTPQANISTLLSSYLTCIKNNFSLNAEQNNFLDKYKSILVTLISIARGSNSINELIEKVDFHEAMFRSYDHTISLDKIIPEQQSALLLSSITNLKFNAYYRYGSNRTLVDAAYLIDGSFKEEQLLSLFSTTLTLGFILENHNARSYIVLKDINLEKVADSIKSRFSDSKQPCLSL